MSQITTHIQNFVPHGGLEPNFTVEIPDLDDRLSVVVRRALDQAVVWEIKSGGHDRFYHYRDALLEKFLEPSPIRERIAVDSFGYITGEFQKTIESCELYVLRSIVPSEFEAAASNYIKLLSGEVVLWNERYLMKAITEDQWKDPTYKFVEQKLFVLVVVCLFSQHLEELKDRIKHIYEEKGLQVVEEKLNLFEKLTKNMIKNIKSFYVKPDAPKPAQEDFMTKSISEVNNTNALLVGGTFLIAAITILFSESK